jgi:hypothetical protein
MEKWNAGRLNLWPLETRKIRASEMNNRQQAMVSELCQENSLQVVTPERFNRGSSLPVRSTQTGPKFAWIPASA